MISKFFASCSLLLVFIVVCCGNAFGQQKKAQQDQTVCTSGAMSRTAMINASSKSAVKQPTSPKNKPACCNGAPSRINALTPTVKNPSKLVKSNKTS